ncbi:MAG: hypothetical protein ACREBR_05640 [bacterium]
MTSYEKKKAYDKAYYQVNRDRLLAKQKIYDKIPKNNRKKAERSKMYRSKNKIKMQGYFRSYCKDREQLDINFRLANRLRHRLYNAIRRSQKKGSAVRDLGCSIKFFKSYLESKFLPEMTWNNYGLHWEIDHVIPLKDFDLTKRKQLLKAVYYMNLQPLLIKDHREKTSLEKESKNGFKIL